jgi:hypothetical protein
LYDTEAKGKLREFYSIVTEGEFHNTSSPHGFTGTLPQQPLIGGRGGAVGE